MLCFDIQTLIDKKLLHIMKESSTSELKSQMGVSKNRGTPKSSVLIRLSILNHPFWGTPIFGMMKIKRS